MKYTVEQIIAILKNPKYKAKIDKGRSYERELRLFTEAQNEDELKQDEAFVALCALIKKRLPEKAYERVKDFIEYPLGAVDLTNGLLVELYKVFQAKNTFFSYEIDSEEKNNKLKEIIKGLDVHNYIIEKGKVVLKNKPNTIVVIDKDKDGKPYIVTVDSERLIDADVKADGTMNYIAFEHSHDEAGKELVAFYDKEFYWVFSKKEKENDFTLVSQIEHKIGYCPAHCFIKTPLNSKNVHKRSTPIATNIGKVREWQLFNIYKYYAEHYASFPIIEKMKARCSEENCVNGFIPNPKGTYFEDDVKKQLPNIPCPSCSKGDAVGVGTVINLKPKQENEDNGKGAFRFISPEITGVEYLGRKLSSLETYIELKTIGQNNLITSEAVNETQVKGSFQSREAVLLNLKELFEEIYIWICETSAKAFFLGDVKVVVYANLGTEFYLIDETELQKRFDNAKKVGLPEGEIDAIYKQLVTTKYKDNPDNITRMDLLKLIDPMPYATFEEVEKLKTSGVITEEEYIIKRRFIKFIDRFEMENANLVSFGNKLPLSERIKKITNILNKYADEYKSKQL